MDAIFEKTLLFDFYGELLTDKQKRIYELYHLDDLSLAEIGEEMGISRQGVFDALKRCHHQLNYFEEKLKLVEHFVQSKSRVEEIYKLVLQLKQSEPEKTQINMSYMVSIEQLAKSILEDL